MLLYKIQSELGKEEWSGDFIHGDFEEQLADMPSSSACCTSESQSHAIQNVANLAEGTSQSTSAARDKTNTVVSVLQDIFPQKEHAQLASASSQCETLQEAIDLLLDSKTTEGIDSEG